MKRALSLTGVLETVLYYAPDEASAMERFYTDVLGMRLVSRGQASLFLRAGNDVVLLFDVEQAARQTEPPPHGAVGPVHTCFLAAADEYEAWKEHLGAAGVTLLDEIEWRSGRRSFYFRDPAGNVLEIADGDLWPR